MKKLFLSFICLLASAILFAQIPQAFNFQSVVRDGDGKLLVEKNIGINVSILQGSATGTKVYEESFTTQTTKTGVASIEVGKGNVVYGKFSDINWGAGLFFLKLSVTLPGTTNVTDMGVVQLLSVPYALYAAKAGDPTWLKIDDFIYSSDIVAINNETTGNVNVMLGAVETDKDGNVSVLHDGNPKGMLASTPNADKAYGSLALLNENDSMRVLLGGLNNGALAITSDDVILGANPFGIGTYDYDDNPFYQLSISDENTSALEMYGANRSYNVYAGTFVGEPNTGILETFNSKGDPLVLLTRLGSYPLGGAISIYGDGQLQGLFQATQSGKSELYVDEIYDTEGYPYRASTTNYSSDLRNNNVNSCFVTEGGGQQITVRGTASLENGKCTIELPADVAGKIEENTITIQIVPLSAESKGLAVTEKNTGSFTVAELMSGKGAYLFDWTLTALAKKEARLKSSVLEENIKIGEPQRNKKEKVDMQDQIKAIKTSVLKK